MLSAQHPTDLTDASPGLRPSTGGEVLGIVAGGGRLPRIVAERARANGWRPFVVAIGDGMREDWTAFEHLDLAWRRTGDVFGVLRRSGARRVVFCGTISIRPDYRSMIPSLRTLRILPAIFRIVRGGDDSLLRAVSEAFEQRGLMLHAVQDFVPELLVPAGALTSRMPTVDEAVALRRAAEASRHLGALDIGQAAVASADRVIALEGIEGTREMLLRVADLRRRGRIGRSERCVLFKGVKPQQDLRFDLPSIGIATVEEAAEAGLSGVGLSAGKALVIGVDEVLSAARRHGLFLAGVPDAGADPESPA